MKRGTFLCAAASAILAPAASAARSLDVASEIDGVVIRGVWRARVTTGRPGITIAGSGLAPSDVIVTRSGSTMTIAARNAPSDGRRPVLGITLARVRGVATSNDVDLEIVDPGGGPLFLDLAGRGMVRASGSVPLLRVTTSGTVRADLRDLHATFARVHARQASRLAVRASNELTIVAVDRARVVFGGTHRVRTLLRGLGTAVRDEPEARGAPRRPAQVARTIDRR